MPAAGMGTAGARGGAGGEGDGSGGGGGDGQTAAAFWLHDDQDELDHNWFAADHVEAIRALLQLLRELVLPKVRCKHRLHVTLAIFHASRG